MSKLHNIRFGAVLALSLPLLLMQPRACFALPIAQEATYVTRGEAAMLILKDKRPPITRLYNDGRYPDVLEDEWYTSYVLAALEFGFWDADPVTNRVHPLALTTRAEFLRMLAIGLDLKKNMPHPYTDIPVDSEIASYAGIASEYRIFLDPKDLRLRSDLPVMHEEAAAALYAIYGRHPDRKPAPRIVFKDILLTPVAQEDTSHSSADAKPVTRYITSVTRDFVRSALGKLFERKENPMAELQRQVIVAVNIERTKNGLLPLKENAFLSAAAQTHARDMAQRGYFSHFTPEGTSYVDRIRSAGYTDVDPLICGCKKVTQTGLDQSERTQISPNLVVYSAEACSCRPQFALGENLAKGQISTEEVVRDWMASENHRKNILYPGFDEIGVAIFRDLWVQEFGRFRLR